jgi:Ca-activated chloride channel family protein
MLTMLLVMALGGEPAQQTPVFRAESRLVNLTVSVTDKGGRYLTGLAADDFAVFEDGEERPVALFRTEDLHLDLIIVMDTSASMRGYLKTAGAAARKLVGTLKPDDHVEVLTFSGGVYRACPFTSDRAVIDVALSFTTPGDDGSRVFRALVDAFREVRAHDEDRERRAAIVLFTDGLDNDPYADDEWLLREASLADAAVYVLLRPVPISAGTDGDYRNPRVILERAARQSGGGVHPLDSPYAVNLAFSRIGSELRAQYRIGYEPSDRLPPDRWRTVLVHVRGGGSPKHKLKYFVPRPR